MITGSLRTIRDGLRAVARDVGVDSRAVITAAACVLVLLQFAGLTVAISRNVDVWPVIQAFDNDGANAIRVAERSRWLTNNRFYPYGNLYFNLAHTVALFDPAAAGEGASGTSLEHDRAHHFGLLFVSLCGIYGIAAVVALGISRSTAFRLVTVFVLVGLFFQNEYWTTWVFRAHPDILFSYFAALALFWTLRSLATGSPGLLRLSAVAWGCALATKLTAVTFLPAVALLFIPPAIKENIRRTVRYYGIVLASYLLIGFPQNFRVFGHFRFLRSQSSLSVEPTLSSVRETFLFLADQALPLLAAIAVLAVLARLVGEGGPGAPGRSLVLKGAVLIGLPLAFLLSQRVLTTHEHYTLPVAACLLVYGSSVLASFAVRLPAGGAMGWRGDAYLVALMLAAVLVVRALPSAIPAVLAEQTAGRSEARAFMAELAALQRDGGTVLADPYVPVDENSGTVQISFFRTEQHLVPDAVRILALSRGYYQRYLDDPPSEYVQKDVPGWRKVRKFYQHFSGTDRARDPQGRIWSRVHDSARGWEIWVRTNGQR